MKVAVIDMADDEGNEGTRVMIQGISLESLRVVHELLQGLGVSYDAYTWMEESVGIARLFRKLTGRNTVTASITVVTKEAV